MLTIHGFLRPEEVGEINRLMDTADFDDGRSTAHGLAAQAKANQQVSRACPAAAALDRIVEAAIRRSRVLVEAVSPCAHSQPLYARYVHGAAYGPHVDAVMNGVPPIRQDLSMTIFLTDPATYEGGGLSLIGAGGERTTVRLTAGEAFTYPTGIIHEVLPVTQGERRAVVLWLQSFFRDPEIRGIVAELRKCLEAMKGTPGADPLPLAKALNTLERKFIGM